MRLTKCAFLVILIIDLLIPACNKEPDVLPDQPGAGISLGSLQVFPSDNPWNTDISNEPVDPNSDNIIAGIGNEVHLHPDFGTVWQNEPIGIPYNVVGKNQEKVAVYFDYDSESDPGPYPIPPDALVESGSDRHVLVIDTFHLKLYELYNAVRNNDHSWNAGSGAVYDLTSNDLRPDYWTSADAAGLPIFPGLVRYEEVVEEGEIDHALRFTVENTRNVFVHPATHAASSSNNVNYPPMGMRVRLKAGFDISGFSPHIQVILTALKKYGMFVTDNGSNWYITGSPDSRWDDDELGELKSIQGKNFEVVKIGTVIRMPE
ncbi:MAG: hypothetical protein JW830_04450 [Bacteroidales bacterium]|nr:hypothetical protein [Bacteroidales bacterium]